MLLRQSFTNHVSFFIIYIFQSRDICTQLQDGLLKVTTELQTVSLTPHSSHQATFLSESIVNMHLQLMDCKSHSYVCENQTLKTYYQYYSEFLSAEGKLKEAVRLEEKQKQSASKKMERQIEKVYFLFNTKI